MRSGDSVAPSKIASQRLARELSFDGIVRHPDDPIAVERHLDQRGVAVRRQRALHGDHDLPRA